MQNAFITNTLKSAMTKATHRGDSRNANIESKARQAQVAAPPFIFGPSVPVIALFGVSGPNAENNVARIRLDF